MAHTVTAEQQQILDAFNRGEHLLVQAGAGCGKTSTIMSMASELALQRPNSRGVYITLNKAMANEVAAKCPPNVTASTIHSLALRCLRNRAPEVAAEVLSRLGGGKRMSPVEAAQVLGMTKAVLVKSTGDGEARVVDDSSLRGKYGVPKDWAPLRAAALYSLARAAVRNYCMSDAPLYTLRFTEAAVRTKLRLFSPAIWDVIIPVVHDAALRILNDAYSIGGKLPYDHDWYLKQWCMIGGRIDEDLGLPAGSVLFFDEVQDSKPAVSAMVERQTDHMQIVSVGDSAQAIYGFTGAVDALPRYADWPRITLRTLSTSWRFGQPIADAANTLLTELEVPMELTGNPALASQVHTYTGKSLDAVDLVKVDGVVCRSNSEVLKTTMMGLAAGRKVHADVDLDRFSRLAEDLQRLSSNQLARSEELRGIANMVALRKLLAAIDPNDTAMLELRADIDLINQVGIDRMRELAAQVVPAAQANLTVCTIHKSKGQQWRRVLVVFDSLVDEVVRQELTDGVSADLLMLVYVAITRAETEVFVPELVFDLSKRAGA